MGNLWGILIMKNKSLINMKIKIHLTKVSKYGTLR